MRISISSTATTGPIRSKELPRYRAQPKRKPGQYDCARGSSRSGLAEGSTTAASGAFSRHVWDKEKLSIGRGPRHHEPVHGRDLRSRTRARRYGFRLPFNLETGELIAQALAALARARSGQSGRQVQARTSRACAASTSTADGATSTTSSTARGSLSKRLASAGIAHTYEEFDDNHSDIDYRMDVSAAVPLPGAQALRQRTGDNRLRP